MGKSLATNRVVQYLRSLLILEEFQTVKCTNLQCFMVTVDFISKQFQAVLPLLYKIYLVKYSRRFPIPLSKAFFSGLGMYHLQFEAEI